MASDKCILLLFPPPPRTGAVTLLEQEGSMVEIPSTSTDYGNKTNKLPPVYDLPDVFLQSGDAGIHASKMESVQMAFLPYDQSIWKKTLHSWQRAGLIGVLEELLESSEDVPSWLLVSANILLNGMNKLTDFKKLIFPQSGLSNEDIIEKYACISNWSKSPVTSLAWHPHVTKLAVAMRDDSILIYGSVTNVNPCLKHKLQNNVADLAWKPFSSSVLAVACQQCILIWHVEPTSLALRPSSSTVQILHQHNHSPVTRLAWSPENNHLFSASPKDSSLLVWDVPREVCIPLKRITGEGVAQVLCSPDGSKLFTAMTAPHFSVWEKKTWHAEVWTHLSSHCSAACWSPDGTVLIFAMAGESALYAVHYSKGVGHGGDMSVLGTSVLLADLSSTTVISSNGEQIRTGGDVKSIVWDKTGERVAVLFEADETGTNGLVAVFKSTIHPVLELLPGGFVRGRPGENAHHIAFQPNFSKGALLSVVWSSGRLGYIPMHFVQAQKICQI